MLRVEFGAVFRKRRSGTINELGRAMSQEGAARLFLVSLSTIRAWENGRSWPDERSRIKLNELWPDLFSK